MIARALGSLVLCLALLGAAAAAPPRARDLGVPFEGEPGPLNAITDVAGVSVGQVTLIASPDPKHEVRTGVTAILPRGRGSIGLNAFAACYALNGSGELTGCAWVEESGLLEGPVVLTNTHSVGVVHAAIIAWRIKVGAGDADEYYWSTPVVGEAWDGYLNDINGFHVRPEHVYAALDGARSGAVEEGNVGAGTGMVCHEFKCGIGTASRIVAVGAQRYTVGVLMQANHGVRDTLRIAGVPIGQHLTEHRIWTDPALAAKKTGSIIIVLATDAPLLPHQLKRLARRAALGLARNGAYAENQSGEIFIAFSTPNATAVRAAVLNTVTFLGNDELDPLFQATAEAVEEAVVNALVAGREMHGQDGHYALALPHERLRSLLAEYHRLARR